MDRTTSYTSGGPQWVVSKGSARFTPQDAADKLLGKDSERRNVEVWEEDGMIHVEFETWKKL